MGRHRFTEHPFHVEGFEISGSPVLLDLFVGLQTRRIRVGQLGIVLPAQNPIRVAEEIAMLDHMTGGRANAGFARGYQQRWVERAPPTDGIDGSRVVDGWSNPCREEKFPFHSARLSWNSISIRLEWHGTAIPQLLSRRALTVA
jgi:luciferase-like monooxygenase